MYLFRLDSRTVIDATLKARHTHWHIAVCCTASTVTPGVCSPALSPLLACRAAPPDRSPAEAHPTDQLLTPRSAAQPLLLACRVAPRATSTTPALPTATRCSCWTSTQVGWLAGLPGNPFVCCRSAVPRHPALCLAVLRCAVPASTPLPRPSQHCCTVGTSAHPRRTVHAYVCCMPGCACRAPLHRHLCGSLGPSLIEPRAHSLPNHACRALLHRHLCGYPWGNQLWNHVHIPCPVTHTVHEPHKGRCSCPGCLRRAPLHRHFCGAGHCRGRGADVSLHGEFLISFKVPCRPVSHLCCCCRGAS